MPCLGRSVSGRDLFLGGVGWLVGVDSWVGRLGWCLYRGGCLILRFEEFCLSFTALLTHWGFTYFLVVDWGLCLSSEPWRREV